MDDLLYPDNPKRETRVQELSDDIVHFTNNLADYADEIRRLLQQLDELLRKLYNKIEVDIPPSATTQINFDGWVADVIEFIEPFIVYPVVKDALQRAAVSWLLRQGRIGEAAFFARLAGLPRWLRMGSKAGGLVAVVGLELGIGGIFGAIKRDKLRDAIHSAIQPRIDFKKAALINGMLKDKLSAVVESCNLMAELGLTKQQIDDLQKKAFDHFKKEVDKITEDTAKEDLARLDKRRDSWTNEDN